MIVTDIDFNSNFEKLLKGLIEGNAVTNFSVDKSRKEINILIGDFNVNLYNNGKWEIG